MRFVIDEANVKRCGFSLQKFLICLAVDTCDNVKFSDLVAEMKKYGVLEGDGDDIRTTAMTKQKLVAALNVDVQPYSEQELLDTVNAMKEFYPKGVKPGTSSTWRGAPKKNAERLAKFLKINGNFPLSDIIQATKEYVQSFRGDYSMMKTLPYFIMKNETDHDENGNACWDNRSKLAEYLDMLGEVGDQDDFFNMGDLITG